MMKKKLPKSIYDPSCLRLLRSANRLIPGGLRLAKAKGKHAHFTGGAAHHRGSKCPGCGRQMALLWDIDLADPLIPDEVRTGFAPAQRLPFYVCWGCMAAAYAVDSNDRIKCFEFDGHTDRLEEGESPFEESPDELPQRKIVFEPVPSTLDALLMLEECIGLEMLDPAARQAINGFYGREITSGGDLRFSQLGGQPLLCQSRRNLVCPDVKCPASKLEHPYGEMEIPYLMKELAVIHYDNEPVLAEHCFQLRYVACAICFSIRGEYRCT